MAGTKEHMCHQLTDEGVWYKESHLLVAENIPNAIAGEDEELVAILQLQMPDLRNCNDHLLSHTALLSQAYQQQGNDTLNLQSMSAD